MGRRPEARLNEMIEVSKLEIEMLMDHRVGSGPGRTLNQALASAEKVYKDNPNPILSLPVFMAQRTAEVKNYLGRRRSVAEVLQMLDDNLTHFGFEWDNDQQRYKKKTKPTS